jgi:hypothetical protein
MVSSPKPPDPYKTADAQTQANNSAAAYNAIIGNPNQYNPYGSVVNTVASQQPIYGKDGKIVGYAPQYEQRTTLSPEQQKLYELETGAKTNLGQMAVNQSAYIKDMLSKPFSTEGMQAWDTGNRPEQWDENAFSADRQRVEQALMSRYNEQSGKTNAAQEAQLAARGLAPGSQQWGDVQAEQRRGANDAVSQAIIGGGTEQSRLLQEKRANWQQGQDYAAFLNNLRGSQVQEGLTMRNQPINEMAALMSGSQVTVPQFSGWNAPSTAAPNIAGMISDNYNTRAQNAASTNSAIFGLAGNVLGAFNPLGRMFPKAA